MQLFLQNLSILGQNGGTIRVGTEYRSQNAKIDLYSPKMLLYRLGHQNGGLDTTKP